MTAAAGFRASGVAAGLKPSGKVDLALIVSDAPAGAAVTTTTNLVKAAPCVVTERHAANGSARAVIVNAGNANACTGSEGIEDALATTREVGALLGIAPEEVLPLSTGIIGVRLPLPALLGGIPAAVGALSPDGSDAAARAICTTDAFTKSVAYRAEDGQGACTIGGIAKGAGMIEPTMATMLCVITTDAPLGGRILAPMVRQAIERTFNRISVDACGSTNDTVVVLANGATDRPPGLATFQRALEAVCADLARKMVEDGEGASRIAELTIGGAASVDDATTLARAVAASTLFRCMLAGADPNWGRILSAMGTSGVLFDPDRVHVTIGGVAVCRFGVVTSFDPAQASNAMRKAAVPIHVDLGLGDQQVTFLASDLTAEYVTFNTEYTT
ncbi:MAG TPA: bifunctional glutamate N-acetyltransferase/amino-acid acetyltransferase ArgJ [Nitriliruptorales bacterium]